MYGCGEQEVGVASVSEWNLWVWLLGVVVRRYIDLLILLIPTPLVSVLFAAASLIFVHKKKVFRSCIHSTTVLCDSLSKVPYLYAMYISVNNFNLITFTIDVILL